MFFEHTHWPCYSKPARSLLRGRCPRACQLAVSRNVVRKSGQIPGGSQNRHWFSATSNVGEGKSPAFKPVVALLESVLKHHAHLCVGLPRDRFQYQQSGTTAAAIDKLRFCKSYLTVHADEAGRCLCPKFASGDETENKQVCGSYAFCFFNKIIIFAYFWRE